MVIVYHESRVEYQILEKMQQQNNDDLVRALARVLCRLVSTAVRFLIMAVADAGS